MTRTQDKPTFADEVVTAAQVRFVQVSGLTGELAMITLDNGHDHTRPNTFGPGGLAALDAALDEIAAHAPAPAAIAVTGKPFIFAVGADLSGVPSISDAAMARDVAETGHRVFRRLKDSAIPTFAFVNGVALGGGLELALHCQYRTISTGSAVAFPEAFLGLVPGWGGTQLLPNLIGIDQAVTVIVENALSQNKVTPGAKAATLGIVDAVFEPADFLERSIEWAVGVLDGSLAVHRPQIDRSGWDEAITRAKAMVAARTRNASPGAVRTVELLDLARNGIDTAAFTAGTKAEDDALADLLMSDPLRASLYSFDLVNKRAKRPAGAPDRKLARTVGKVGVVGTGLMASQLAMLFVRQLKALVTGSLSKDVFADADLVIEAVFEEMSVKQQVFAELEGIVSPECVLATNTSALSITEMASKLQHPERVVGLHFFNPVTQMPLVEVVGTPQSSPDALATAFAVAQAMKKTAVPVADRPGFVVNRLLLRLLAEVLATVEDGTPVEVADAALRPLGLPMGPFALLELVGTGVARHVLAALHDDLGPRYRLSPGLDRLDAERRQLVLRTGRVDGSSQVDPEVQNAFRAAAGTGLDGAGVLDVVLTGLTSEIGLMLEEDVVDSPEQIDRCLLLGARWPFHLGGICPYLDRSGYSERILGHRLLPPGTADVLPG